MELSDATEKNPVTPGIDPVTFRLVAQCLNHYANPGPNRNEYQEYFLRGKGGRCVCFVFNYAVNCQDFAAAVTDK
jgi:hypothetical protein